MIKVYHDAAKKSTYDKNKTAALFRFRKTAAALLFT
jgi:hypothetical protein